MSRPAHFAPPTAEQVAAQLGYPLEDVRFVFENCAGLGIGPWWVRAMFRAVSCQMPRMEEASRVYQKSLTDPFEDLTRYRPIRRGEAWE